MRVVGYHEVEGQVKFDELIDVLSRHLVCTHGELHDAIHQVVTLLTSMQPGRLKPMCARCGTGTSHDYMLTNSLWRQAAGDDCRCRLCLGCVESMLGRPLVAEDFTDIPMNTAIRYLLSRKP